MNILNFTPHTLNFYQDDLGGNELVLELPSDGIARVHTVEKIIESLSWINGENCVTTGNLPAIELQETEFGEVAGLPNQKEETIIVVSLLVRQALPDRTDLYSPGRLLRNSKGQPIGCFGLTR